MGQDHAHGRIYNWLDAVILVPDIQSSKQPRKCLRLDNNEHVHNEYFRQILNREQITQL
ncbi:hypothetical protein BJX70DRAFT_367542 [Aspergillus crustosus]